MPGFWDVLRGAAQVVGRILPCHVCGAPGAQVCSECFQVGCHRHSYSNIGLARSICSACLAEKFDWAATDINPPIPEDWPYELSPWEILGVSPGASPVEVSKAHREASKLCHPDHEDGDEQQQIALNRAREVMLGRAV